MSPTRRDVLSVAGLTLAGTTALGLPRTWAADAPAASPGSPPSGLAYVGCRTSRSRAARGRGISTFHIGPDGCWALAQIMPGPENPSYLALDRTGRFLYAVHGDGTEISAYRIRQNGMLEVLNSVTTGGTNPVFVSPDAGNTHMLVANYTSGSIAALPIALDGRLSPPSALLTLEAPPGPNPIEQRSPHPHQICFGPGLRHLYVPDKGSDRIYTLGFDPIRQQFAIEHTLRVTAGSGPRHIAFHPHRDLAFVSHELSSQFGVYGVDAGSGMLQVIAMHSTLPPGATGSNTAAAIVATPDGNTVFVTNRGHDSVMCATIDPQDGSMVAARWIGSGGRGPRFATLDHTARRLLVANELSDGVSIFAMPSGDEGKLPAPAGTVETGSPVCIVLGSAT